MRSLVIFAFFLPLVALAEGPTRASQRIVSCEVVEIPRVAGQSALRSWTLKKTGAVRESVRHLSQGAEVTETYDLSAARARGVKIRVHQKGQMDREGTQETQLELYLHGNLIKRITASDLTFPYFAHSLLIRDCRLAFHRQPKTEARALA